ncbi:23S rRNA (uracil(1939)-C(5))-methyltransferase RlmD [Thermoactinomyces vulgaris]|jgi:23S rRNA (uracil1939-C5)-methyltransferase|uniref:23S rRNA (uracil(1939)-C(5))-methyltransferase RlmD n=1 Tax=Thermoactinomyces vulgaris TaxID=2026 RepID=UPI0011079AAC|nr:23S rRNA (uracil(1939)-C(5))-methyltransferase RlmD [Thermoactinomyces vulgaris]QCV54664.1 23S rRNA (uracil(1939)-C(5))-methyltransferase RlmD [Thermoactinomyces vulgaris]
MKKANPPVKTGDVIEMEITGLSHDGAGVGKYQGFTIFVPQTVPDEKVRVRVQVVKKTYGKGEAIQVLKSHPRRTEPPCPIYHECGGCQIQHLQYPAQLEYKRQQVADHFERIGGMQVPVLPVLGMEDPWRYRNKAQVPLGWEDGKVKAGFYAAGSHRIVDMEACLIQHEANDQAVRKVKELARELKTPVYDETKHQGCLRHVMVRTGFHTGEMMIVLVTNGKKLPHRDKWVEALRKEFPALKSLIQNINSKRTNVVLGPENEVLWGRDFIYDRIGEVTFAISPHSFFQVNPVQTQVLYDQVARYAGLTGHEVVIDAYCGIGTIALYLAQNAKRVYGVEIVPAAVRDAKRNAKINGMDHVTFETGAAEEVLPRWYKEGIRPDVVVVDPPRKGCDRVLLDTLVSMQPERLVYVSCNSSTLARDAKYLAECGYRVQEVQPVDMFPQTGHIENVAMFKLENYLK